MIKATLLGLPRLVISSSYDFPRNYSSKTTKQVNRLREVRGMRVRLVNAKENFDVLYLNFDASKKLSYFSSIRIS